MIEKVVWNAPLVRLVISSLVPSVVAVKSGRSAAGTRAAASHSAALASLDVAVDALFEQAGVIRTSTLEELFDVAVLLATQPIPAGRRVGVVTNAGGPGILLADACEAQGLELPKLADDTLQTLRDLLPAGAGLYRLDDDGWTWIGADVDTVRRTVTATSRQLGTFAVLVDTLAPRAVRWELVRDAAGGAYSRWAIEAVIEEDGSGVDARGSWFEVDGRRVAAEWDPEANRLRWRPAERPERLVHEPPFRDRAVLLVDPIEERRHGREGRLEAVRDQMAEGVHADRRIGIVDRDGRVRHAGAPQVLERLDRLQTDPWLGPAERPFERPPQPGVLGRARQIGGRSRGRLVPGGKGLLQGFRVPRREALDDSGCICVVDVHEQDHADAIVDKPPPV